MGLDFSYLLYFKRERLWDALQGVAALCRPNELPALIVFPDHILSLSIEPWDDKDRMVKCDEPEFGFKISMYFLPDDSLKEYLQRAFSEYYEEMSKESPLGLPVGYIYLTVYNDMHSLDQEPLDPDLVMMEFGTTGTRMSLLFSESVSIRKQFTTLLEQYSGVCGMFNMEMEGLVFWLNGRRMEEQISDPWMHPKMITDELKEAPG